MTNVKGFNPDSGSAPTLGSDNDRVIPKFPGQRRSPEQKPAPIPGQRTALGPRPPLPAPTLTARPLSRELAAQGWDQIPTARTAPVHLTRAQLDRELAAARQHEPYLIGYSGIQARAAFGGAV